MAQVASFAIVSMTHLLAIVMVTLMLVWTFGTRGGLALDIKGYQGIYNWHPLLMLVGFILLFGEAIQAYRVLPYSKFTRKIIHAVLNGTGLALAIVGISFVWYYHEKTGDPHLTSIHAWFGFTTVIIFALQWISGLVLFLVPATPVEVRKASLPIHVLAGLYLFMMVLLIACLGILEKLTFLTDAGTITRRGADTLLGNFLAIFILLWGGFVIYILVWTEKPVEGTPSSEKRVSDAPEA